MEDIDFGQELIDLFTEQLASNEQKQHSFEYSDAVDTNFPDPANFKFFRNSVRRYLYLEDEIDAASVYIANDIIEWNLEDDLKGLPVEERIPIKIYISSPGGLLQESFCICDAIRMSKTPVYTINIGCAASAAALIFSCGHKRIATPSASFLLHLGYGGTEGTYQQTKAQQRNYDALIANMKNILKEQLQPVDEEEFETLIDGEWYLYMFDKDPNSVHNPRKYNLITEEMTSLSQLSK